MTSSKWPVPPYQLDVPQPPVALKGQFVVMHSIGIFSTPKRCAVSSANQCAHIFVGNKWLLRERLGSVHLAVVWSQQWLEWFLYNDLLLVLQRFSDRDSGIHEGWHRSHIYRCHSVLFRRCGLQLRGKLNIVTMSLQYTHVYAYADAWINNEHVYTYIYIDTYINSNGKKT